MLCGEGGGVSGGGGGGGGGCVDCGGSCCNSGSCTVAHCHPLTFSQSHTINIL